MPRKTLLASAAVLSALVLLLGGLAWALVPENLGSSPAASVQQEKQTKSEYDKLRKEIEDELQSKQPVPGVNQGGGEGNDIIQGTEERDTLGGGRGDGELWGYGGDDKLYAAIGNDTLSGGSGSDVLLGAWGNDTLSGGPGSDQLFGRDGDDSIDDGDDDVGDIVDCGKGFDTVTVGAEDTVLGCEDVTTR